MVICNGSSIWELAFGCGAACGVWHVTFSCEKKTAVLVVFRPGLVDRIADLIADLLGFIGN